MVPEQRLDRNGRLVTRHVRQESRGDAGKHLPSPAPIPRKNEVQADAETALLSLHAAEDGQRNGSGDRLWQKYTIEELGAALAKIFEPSTLRHAADLMTNSAKPELMHWLLRGMPECAEEYLDWKGGPPPEMTTLGRYVELAVERARAINVCTGYSESNRDFNYMLSVVQSQSHSAANQAIRDGVMFDVRHHDYDQHKFVFSLLVLNLVSAPKARQERSYQHPAQLKRIYEERDRILPHLPEFQKREAFSFDLLDDLEKSSSPSLTEGVL